MKKERKKGFYLRFEKKPYIFLIVRTVGNTGLVRIFP